MKRKKINIPDSKAFIIPDGEQLIRAVRPFIEPRATDNKTLQHYYDLYLCSGMLPETFEADSEILVKMSGKFVPIRGNRIHGYIIAEAARELKRAPNTLPFPLDMTDWEKAPLISELSKNVDVVGADGKSFEAKTFRDLEKEYYLYGVLPTKVRGAVLATDNVDPTKEHLLHDEEIIPAIKRLSHHQNIVKSPKKEVKIEEPVKEKLGEEKAPKGGYLKGIIQAIFPFVGKKESTPAPKAAEAPPPLPAAGGSPGPSSDDFII